MSEIMAKILGFKLLSLPLGSVIEGFTNWLTSNFYYQFRTISAIFKATIEGIDSFLILIPPPVFIAVVGLVAWKVRSIKVAIFVSAGMLFLLSIGLWEEVMLTLSMVATAVLFSLLVAIPTGIFAAHVKGVFPIIRPILDFMQTIPAYVYLLPAIMLFGLGTVPGVIATMIFAIPPPLRLTYLGITEVPKERKEAGEAFGASTWQMLTEIELPSAFPNIMLGINQCIMMALSMVVLAALIGAGGLGKTVWEALSLLEIGNAFEAGLGIVIIAMVLDRLLGTSK